MLDELLTQKPGANRNLPIGYPDIPNLSSKDELVALHREIAHLDATDAAAIVTALVQVVADAHRVMPGAPQLDTEAIWKSVEHVVWSLRWNAVGGYGHYVREELTKARTWRDQARMSSSI